MNTKEDVEEFGDWIYDFYGRKRFARDMAKSREEGILKGREEERQKNVLNMLKMKYPLASIATILQLSEDEILKIAKENGIDIPCENHPKEM